MRIFLIRSALFLGLSILVTIGIFLWLNSATVLPAITEQVQTFRGASPTKESSTPEIDPSGTNTAFDVPQGGIPLSSLTLGENQKKALETAGIDTNTFVITEAMISCGVEKLGNDRANEIFDGGSPTIFETGKLATCLGS